MFAFLKRIFEPRVEISYTEYLAQKREFEHMQDDLADLKTRFNRFQNRQLMREAREEKNIDSTLLNQARSIMGDTPTNPQKPTLVPGTFRRRE